jgi:hypothetical protein
MMSVADIEKLTKVMESMIQCELLLSDFYKHCADVWTDDQELWNTLAIAEIRHADHIQKMKDIVVRKQESFALGRPFNLIALNTVAAGLKDNAIRLKLGGLSREKILIMARDIEQSVIESNYAEIVKTADVEYSTLVNVIIEQTYEHKKTISGKIAEMQGKA